MIPVQPSIGGVLGGGLLLMYSRARTAMAEPVDWWRAENDGTEDEWRRFERGCVGDGRISVMP